MPPRRNFRSEIIDALDYAPIEGVSTVGTLIDNDGKIEESNQIDDDVSQLSDNHLLKVNVGYQSPRNGVTAGNPFEFRQLIWTALSLGPEVEYDVEGTVKHEDGHLEILRALGGVSCGYQITMHKVAVWDDVRKDIKYDIYFKPHTIASDLHVPKLAVASMLVRPKDPSDEDLLAAAKLGYEGGVEEIGDRIVKFNDRHPNNRLLLPLSYQNAA